MSSSWEVKTLDELIDAGIVELGRGKIISKKDLAASPGNYPVYSSAKNNDGKFGEYGNYMFNEELITWSVDGGGRLFHRDKHKFSVTNVGGILRIKNTDVIGYRYLFYCLTLLHSKINFDWVKKAHPSVIRKIYNVIPVPSMAEQKRIVAILNNVFVGIDAAIENTENNIANVHELFESYLNSVFTNCGDEWVSKPVGDIADHCLGKMLDKRKNKGTPRHYLRNLNVQWFDISTDDLQEMKFEEKEEERFSVKKGDLLICEGGYPGRAAIWEKDEPIFFQKALHRVRFKEPLLNKWLLYFLYLSDVKRTLHQNFTGAGIQHFTGKALKQFQLPLAPISEIKLLLEKIDDIYSETQCLEIVYKQKLNALNQLKLSLLKKAFSGELTSEGENLMDEAVA